MCNCSAENHTLNLAQNTWVLKNFLNNATHCHHQTLTLHVYPITTFSSNVKMSGHSKGILCIFKSLFKSRELNQVFFSALGGKSMF